MNLHCLPLLSSFHLLTELFSILLTTLESLLRDGLNLFFTWRSLIYLLNFLIYFLCRRNRNYYYATHEHYEFFTDLWTCRVLGQILLLWHIFMSVLKNHTRVVDQFVQLSPVVKIKQGHICQCATSWTRNRQSLVRICSFYQICIICF